MTNDLSFDTGSEVVATRDDGTILVRQNEN